ncbi:MAG TPA: alkaline phosphatase family protein [Stellaceae bacterium]|nr:alkaline phosphatase family protein [Stellaceae bacterium]
MQSVRQACILALGALLPLITGCSGTPAQTPSATATPIKHLIVVVGENVSFDALFATYRPPAGQSVANLLSKGIVKADGSPGPQAALARQRLATVRGHYEVTPRTIGTYRHLPRPGTTYAAGQPQWAPDRRFPDDLPNAPFQITRYADWMATVGDPVHRFFQMWQQVDGGRHDLFVWVDMTSGEGSRKHSDPRSGTNQGAVAMGFYNMAAGDAPYFKELAETYALADNYHQPIMGGTGANYFALATGDVAVYLADDGKPAMPPGNQIENPDPRRGSNNWYTQSGYFSGSYTACADPAAPGVKAIRGYLARLPYRTFNDGNCEPGAYYLVNNYRPGFTPAGERRPLGPDQYVLPPQIAPTIGEALAAKDVSWKWYQGGRRADGTVGEDYCPICDPFTHSTAIMTGALRNNLRSYSEFDGDLANGSLPAVAFVTPPNQESGHPAYSVISRYEAFLKQLVSKVEAHPEIWKDTAILATTDEGGGYYDSGYIQILDFFGDGTRIPMIAISPFARKGAVDHTYYDHASILKFIEMNWGLKPLSARSRDNLPNPLPGPDVYVPANRPAIGDLTNLFDFGVRK